MAIETSCDETAAAVVRDGREVLSSVISSQTEFHKKYGGIVPEVAARKHIEVISPVIKEAMETAKAGFRELDAVAVTCGPGLVGSLIVGLSAAKAIAWSINKPLIGVNHLEGHIYANFLNPNLKLQTSKQKAKDNHQKPNFPFVCLLVSGGHTMIIKVNGHGVYQTLGRTRDDAAGEAFDKVARFLGLGYPGGPVIDRLAKEGNPKAVKFTRPLPDGYDFSFSGIKTGVVNVKSRDPGLTTRDIVASFQQAVVDVLVDKAVRAALDHGCQTMTLAGGVSANSLLRSQLEARGEDAGLKVVIPPFEYCTDNAAMIASAGFYKYINSSFVIRHSSLSLEAVASLRLE
ncbi:MAG: tRNA (adenosine(37)-N6)-threonylcarbamoyltransferase complex transferase subunit TsaD [Candidatus Saganbacteria bacterium]|nr:tRNA (adenosine(37)-N6)-threonylcarbamoyltransferase complex transferase subunit TsaD [Candidatus Saganbacteria bacterium]